MANQGDDFPTGREDVGYGKAWERYAKGDLARILVKGSDLPLKKGGGKEPAAATEMMPKVTNAMTVFMREIGNNSEVREHLKDPRIAEAFGNAAVAVGRSSIATLGFDPGQTVLDIKAGHTNISGMTMRQKMYVNLGNQDQAGTVVHEAIHNGIAKLINAEDEDGQPIPEGVEAYNLLNKLKIPEEDIVRYLVARKMGDPESKENEYQAKLVQKAFQKFTPEKEKMMEQIEKLAEKVWRRYDTKMGPR